jgi:hypothetical protein
MESSNIATLNSTTNEYDITISGVTEDTLINGYSFTFKTPSSGCTLSL